MRQIPNWIDGYMQLTENSEPPNLYRKWAAVFAIAACLQRKCFLMWDKPTYPNLYIAFVAPSGKCRKGTALEPAFLMLRSIGVKMAAEATTRESLIKELANCKDTYLTEAGVPVEHCSLTVFSKELTVFLGYNNLALLSDLTDWYDCASEWVYRTKTSGEFTVNGVWLNLLGGTTPEALQSALPRDAIGGGLTSRIIFVYEDRKAKYVPLPFPTTEEITLGVALEDDLQSILAMSGKFTITEDFLYYYPSWYISQSETQPFEHILFNAYFERRATHALKLSMIMSAARSSDRVITAADLKKAISLLEETEIKMPYTFSGVGKAEKLDVTSQVMAYIVDKREVDYVELLKTFYHDADNEELKRIVASLQAMDFISLRQDVDKKTVFVIYKEAKV
jgi:hypothetical protein